MIPLTVPETARLLNPPAPTYSCRALAELAALPPGPLTLAPLANKLARDTEIILVS